MKLSCNYPTVDVNLENGVYVFNDESASGKTYLLYMLNKMSNADSVIGFTYTDSLSNSINMEKCIGRHIIMFDRYDMYRNKYADIIKKLKNSSIILIDCKNLADMTLDVDLKDCIIELEENSIEVFI